MTQNANQAVHSTHLGYQFAVEEHVGFLKLRSQAYFAIQHNFVDLQGGCVHVVSFTERLCVITGGFELWVGALLNLHKQTESTGSLVMSIQSWL